MHRGDDREFGPHFTPLQIQTLWQRFAALDQALQTDREQYLPGLQIPGPSRYRLYDLPPDFGLREFVASWPAD